MVQPASVGFGVQKVSCKTEHRDPILAGSAEGGGRRAQDVPAQATWRQPSARLLP